MYIPAYFQIDDQDILLALMQKFSFAVLVTPREGTLAVSHLPLLVEEGPSGLKILGHVARGNDHWRSLGQAESVAIFQGPHSYVSPSLYLSHPSVPTWNYAVVHAHGTARVIDDTEEAIPLLKKLVDKYEGPRPQPWEMMDLPADYLDKMVKAIVAFEISPVRLEGKFKLNQNRSPEDQQHVVDTLLKSPEELDRQLGELMQERITARSG